MGSRGKAGGLRRRLALFAGLAGGTYLVTTALVSGPLVASKGSELVPENPVAVAATTASTTPLRLTISCPPVSTFRSSSSFPVTFGFSTELSILDAARWSIDYGDGQAYQSSTPGGVFSHTYTMPGSFTVNATMWDKQGNVTSDSCAFSWWRATPTTRWTPPPTIAPRLYFPPGGYNSAGCPRDQYVRGYTRSDGTYVDGYYRNSPHDGCGGG